MTIHGDGYEDNMGHVEEEMFERQNIEDIPGFSHSLPWSNGREFKSCTCRWHESQEEVGDNSPTCPNCGRLLNTKSGGETAG
jgi:hypothetical protein